MKNRNIIKLFTFLWSALLIVSCSNEDLDRKDGPTVPEGIPVTLTLNVGTPDVSVVETKALENDDKTFGIIKDLAVIVYDEKGKNPEITYRVLGTPATSVKDIHFNAKTGKRKIYVLANVGSIENAKAYTTEEDLLAKTVTATINPTGDEMMLGCVERGLNSMDSSSEAYYRGSANMIDIQDNESFSARVIPPYSKITFNVSMDLQEHVLLSISEVSVHCMPNNYSFLPKRWTFDEVNKDGLNIYTKKSDSDDLGDLKDGISFYMYENKQGQNGAVDTPSSQKAPEGLEYNETNGTLSDWYEKWSKTSCTYIQVKGKYTIFTEENGRQDVGTGEIYYRFFLGENTSNDFNIGRNTHYNVTLAFTKKAGKNELDYQWRVFADLNHSTFVPEGTLEIDGSLTYFPFYVVNASGNKISVTTDIVGYSDMKLRYKNKENDQWFEGSSDLGEYVPNGSARYCGVSSVNLGVFGNISKENDHKNCYRMNGVGDVVNTYADNKNKQADVVAGNIFRIRHFYITGDESSTLNVKEYPLLWLYGDTKIAATNTTAIYVQRIDRPDGTVDRKKALSICDGQNHSSGLLNMYLPTLEDFKLMINTETGPLKPNTERAYWTKAGLFYWPLNGGEPRKCENNVGYVRCVYKREDK